VTIVRAAADQRHERYLIAAAIDKFVCVRTWCSTEVIPVWRYFGMSVVGWDVLDDVKMIALYSPHERHGE